VWTPRFIQSSSVKSIPAWVLLADGTAGGRGFSLEVQQMSDVCASNSSTLKTIPLTWPFAVWGLNMVGPFKPARGKMTHILVMVDKFTKWIEVKPISMCDGHTVVKILKGYNLEIWCPPWHHH
jgi:hypothetical protein